MVTDEMVEKAARCIDPDTFAILDGGDQWRIINSHHQREAAKAKARAAIEAALSAAEPAEELSRINEMMDEGDDEGSPILPEFEESWSVEAKVEACLHLLEKRRDVIEGFTAKESWRDDPSQDERWNAGLDFAMTQLCKVLKVDPQSINWDCATETLEGDAQSQIHKVLAAAAPYVQQDEDDKAAINLGASVLSRIADPEARETAIRNALAAALSAQVQDVAGLERLRDVTYAVQHNPNCPANYLVRLVGKSGRIDLKPYGNHFPSVKHETGDVLGFGKTLDEAIDNALAATAPENQDTAAKTAVDYRHKFEPNKKYPWFCAVCGYAPHEPLKHLPAAPAAKQGEAE